jgi:predicted phosphodiesterase
MRLGVASDVHGNRVALEAVVADGEREGVDRWWLLGDLVAIGPDPVATLDLVGNLRDATVTRGNTERYVLTSDRPPPRPAEVVADPGLLGRLVEVEASFSWTRGALAAHGLLGALATLPLEARLRLPDGARLLGVHASPGRDDGPGISPDRPDDELHRAVAGADADIVIAGHTHQPTDRVVGGVRAVNDGSVGNPMTDDLRASYVIVHADRHGHRVAHRRVGYDRDRFIGRVRASGHPAEDFIVSFQRGEQGRYPSRRPGAPTATSPPGGPGTPC